MRIGIELRHITVGGSGGISFLLKGVLEALFAQPPRHEVFVFGTVFNRCLLPALPAHVQFLTPPISSFFPALDQIATEKKLDVLMRSFPAEADLAFPLHRQVVLIPDIQHEYFPDFFDAETLRLRRLAFGQALAGAGAIGTISEHARRTLLEQDYTTCRDIFLMCPALLADHADAAATAALTPAEEALIPQGDFFFFPANLWPHKNHRRLLQAFELFLQQTGRPATLVLTGHPDGWPALRADFPELPVRHLGFVRAPVLRALLTRARALVYFSLYEGFGIPLLEAFHAGTPVVCSNTTSLPEVGGDAVLACDPTDVPAMAAQMARVVEDEALRQELVRRGAGRLGIYTWEESARNLLAAFGRVAALPVASPTGVVRVTEPPLVSIVTPSYNQGRFLRRTIDSVLSQNYPRIEYQVMDGGSTDESVEVLRSYGDRVRWVSEPDRGQTHAINKGFAQARGEIHAYLNSDDVLLPGAVPTAVAHFLRHPDWDMIYGRAHYIDEDDRVTGDYRTADYSFAGLIHDCFVCQPAAFWRSRIARRVGPFNEALNYAMDYDYWIRIDRAGGRIAHVPELLACSRLYAATKTMSARRDIYREIIDVCLTRAGRVDLNFVYGQWHHLLYEEQAGLWPLLAFLRPALPQLARWQHKWYNRHAQYPWKRILGGLTRRALHRMGPVGRLVGQAQQRLHAPPPRRPRVSGFWPDNWIDADFRVIVPDRAGPLYLAGTAPVDATLTVSAGGRVIGIHPVRAHVREEIAFRLSPPLGREVHLHFSHHATDPAGRRLAFLLEDTNVFAERDLAA